MDIIYIYNAIFTTYGSTTIVSDLYLSCLAGPSMAYASVATIGYETTITATGPVGSGIGYGYVTIAYAVSYGSIFAINALVITFTSIYI